MRFRYEYALVGDPDGTVRELIAGRPSVYAAEDHFDIGLIGSLAKGEVSVQVMDWILHHAHTRAVQKGETLPGDVALTWSEFSAGELEGAIDWSDPEALAGNPRSPAA